MEQDQSDVANTNKTRSVTARRPSAIRSRRRADKLTAEELRRVQLAFEFRRNSEDVGRNALLPRPEVIDGVLIGHGITLKSLAEQVHLIRREMGMAQESTGKIHIVSRRAA